MRALRVTVYLVTGAYWIVLFILTHTPAERLPQPGVSDKLAHFLAYAVLGLFLFSSFWISGVSPKRAVLLTLAIGLIYGVADEWIQKYVGRDCEFQDWLADAAGIVAAVLVLALTRHFSTMSRHHGD
jgi:VanZ family protein